MNKTKLYEKYSDKKFQISHKIRFELLIKLEEKARKENKTKSEIVEQALEEYFKEEE